MKRWTKALAHGPSVMDSEWGLTFLVQIVQTPLSPSARRDFQLTQQSGNLEKGGGEVMTFASQPFLITECLSDKVSASPRGAVSTESRPVTGDR
jgi:hypothetical protein